MNSISGLSLNVGEVFGIPIKIHWSFSLLLVFVGYVAYTNNIPRQDLVWFFSYVLLLFVFVVMHEFGHALTAKRFNVKTRDIIISPIGGIARLERLPELPRQELIVAIAGPAVNVVLAIVFLIVQVITSDSILPSADRIDFSGANNFIGYLLMINIVLVVFNLIPAFPMDGGRVLRSLLTMWTKDRLVATKWAVRIGHTIALGFLIMGILWDHYMLIFIAIFVYVTARAEYNQIKLQHLMNNTLVKDIMRANYTVLKSADQLNVAIEHGNEQNFLIADDADNIIGTLPELYLKEAKSKNQLHLPVKDYMHPAFGSLLDSLPLTHAFKLLNDRGWAIAEVIDEKGNKKGVIDRQLLRDFMRSV